MASVYKDKTTGLYYAQFYDSSRRPKQKKVPTGLKTKKEAESLLRDMAECYEKGTYDPWLDPSYDPTCRDRNPALWKGIKTVALFPTSKKTPLQTAVDEFLEFKKTHLAKTTCTKYEDTLRLLVAYLGPDFPTIDITERHISKWLFSSERRTRTLRDYRATVRTFVRWGMKFRYFNSDFTEDVPLRKVPKKLPKWLKPDELDRMIEAIQEEQRERITKKKNYKDGFLWLIPILKVAPLLGLRRAEIVSLTWEDIDFDAYPRPLIHLTIVENEGKFIKNGQEAILPIPEPAVEVFRELYEKRGEMKEPRYVFQHSQGRIAKDHLTHAFLKMRKRAGIRDGITVHSLRHTTASWMAKAGCHIEVIRRWMRHADTRMTEKYMHLSTSDFHDAALLALEGREKEIPSDALIEEFKKRFGNPFLD